MNHIFTEKTLLITGGTGSFGNAVLNRFLRTDIGEIRIFSRDEKKQDDMRHEFQMRLPEAAEKLQELAQPGDLIVTAGAGDIYTVGEMLLSK